MVKELGEDFFYNLKKAVEQAKELINENAKFKFEIKKLTEELERINKEVKQSSHNECLKQINELKALVSQYKDRILELETENKNFAQKYVDLESENNNLANLYVASFQLHSTLNFKEVVQIIMEIVINLIGAEVFVLYLLDEKSNELSPIATEGIEIEKTNNLKLGKGIVGRSAKTGENYFSEIIPFYDGFNEEAPIACIPLKIKEHTIGVIAIYKLLMQKEQFTDLDYELFTLLAGHAATAIFSSKLYTESERKLSTIQGFIELLTK